MPDISAQLLEAVQSAYADGTALDIRGYDSKAFLGRTRSGVPLSVIGHSGVVHYNSVELVITVRAGTSLSDIQAALDEHHQTLSFEPPCFAAKDGVEGASIGGTLAANVSGPARPWSGSVRDMVLGTRLINGRGEHLRFGGEVMKNVAGYDASRLQAGALGTLGLLTEISLKVLPKHAASRTVVVQMDPNEAVVTMNRLAGQAKPLWGACWIDGHLYLRLSGSGSAVDGAVKHYPGMALDNQKALVFWSELANHRSSFFEGEGPLWRFSVNSSAPVLLPSAASMSDMSIDWGGSQRWLRGEYDKREMESMAIKMGGQVTLYRGGDRRGEVFHSVPAPLQELQSRVKASFDPKGLFNPGRLYSWL